MYFPSSGAPWEGRYLVTSTLVIPDHLQRIVGFESLILGARGSVFTDANGVAAVFRIDGTGTSSSLEVEGLRLAAQGESLAGAIWFDHRSPRSVTLRHVQAGGAQLAYRGNADAGR